jgi:hypothetical protein
LNVDEVIVTGKLRSHLGRHAEVLMPLNAQLKDIDLIVMNMKNKKSVTLQVKGSRAYDPSKMEIERYQDGSTCWFLLAKKTIDDSTADYFVFVLYASMVDKTRGRLSLEPHILTMRPNELSKLCCEYKAGKKGDNYNFAIWIDPIGNRVFDFRTDKGRGEMNLSQFLDEQGFDQIRGGII